MTADYKVTPFDERDLDAVAALKSAAFGRVVTADELRWKYFANPAGPIVASVARAEAVPVAFFGVLPERWKVEETEIVAHQSIDTATHPEHQRRGLFVRLATATERRLADRSDEYYLLGIPGATSLPGFVDRLGWSCVHEFRLVVLPSPVLVRRSRLKPVSLATGGEDDGFGRRDWSTPGRVRPVFDADHLQWRFGANPQRPSSTLVGFAADGEPCGVAVYTVDARRRSCLQFVGGGHQPAVSEAALLAATIVHMRHQGVRSPYYAWEPSDPTWAHAFRRLGFLANPFSRGPGSTRVPFIVKPGANARFAQAWLDPRSYSLQAAVQD